MNPNEFKIGNLVDVINRTGEVHLPTGITLRIIAVGLFAIQCVPAEIPNHKATPNVIMDIPLKDVVGIPITAENLPQLGFKPPSHSSWFSNLWLEINPKIKNEFGVHARVRVGGNVTSYLNHYTYVHQIQNLYLDLSHEEIEIKLPLK